MNGMSFCAFDIARIVLRDIIEDTLIKMMWHIPMIPCIIADDEHFNPCVHAMFDMDQRSDCMPLTQMLSAADRTHRFGADVAATPGGYTRTQAPDSRDFL